MLNCVKWPAVVDSRIVSANHRYGEKGSQGSNLSPSELALLDLLLYLLIVKLEICSPDLLDHLLFDLL